MEEWKPVKDFEDYYEVSDKGRVRSLDRRVSIGGGSTRISRGKLLSLRDNNSGYKFVTLHDATTKRSISRYVHALVAESFLGFVRGEDMTVDHIDEDNGNNRVENLRILSQSDNSKRWRNKIEGWDTTKIDVDTARLIRYYYSMSSTTYKQLSNVFGLSTRGIQKCVKRETWKNVI